MASNKRIIWFLALQRVLPFPGHFLAPLARKFVNHAPVHHELDPESGLSRPSRSVGAFEVRHRGDRQSPTLERHRLAVPGSFVGSLAINPPRPESSAHFSSGPVQWRSNPPQRSFNRSPQSIGSSVRPARIPMQEISIAKKHGQGLPVGSAASLAPNVSSVLGPSSMLTILDIQNRLSPDLNIHSDRPNFFDGPSRASAYSSFEPHDPRQTRAGLIPLSSDESAAVSDNNDGSSEKHSVSTLHIDGSALGRWAIQHLERALGKPASGMTGVDPRATVPRSRVAPF